MYGNALIFPGTLADEIKHQHFKNVYPKGITRTRTALDSLLSVERKEAERNEVSSDLFLETDDDGNKEVKAHTSDGNATDSSGNGTRFKLCTGVFSVDFPPSPKVPKGKGKKSKQTTRQQLELSGAESDVTTVMPTQTQDLTVSGPPSGTSDSGHCYTTIWIHHIKKERGKGPQATNQGAQMLEIGIVRIQCRQLKSPRDQKR